MKTLKAADILNYSGHLLRPETPLPVVRSGHYRVVDASVTGDAPKDFIRVYEFGTARKASPHLWPAWIAKVGHKWYPNESVTEHLLTRIGQSLGIPMADSRLMMVRGQLRFGSRYFLRPDESLVHGAEIFADYLEDRGFVEEVEDKDQSRDLFTFQFVEDALLHRFPGQCVDILSAFVRMLAFDAIVGNNDRHFYNWGVITDVRGHQTPRFSPVYDSARALFWNDTEAKLAEVVQSRRKPAFLEKYVKQSLPKTGWDRLSRPNHFQLINALAANRPAMLPLLQSLADQALPDRVAVILAEEFQGLVTPLRQDFVLDCLRLRLNKYQEAIQTAPL
jgi:hypothetical protein